MNVILNDDLFGRNLSFLRHQRATSPDALAAFLGIDLQTLRAIEAGTLRELPVSLMVAAGSYFHVSLADLLSGPIQ